MDSQNSNLSTYVYCPYHAVKLTIEIEDDGREVPACPVGECGFRYYGNPTPCVAVLLEYKGAILLGSRRYEPAKGEWDVLGGFIDAGETAEKAVRREISEETGLILSEIRYLTSLPDTYGGRSAPTLNLCFTAQATNLPDDLPIDEDLDPSVWPYDLTSDVDKLRFFSPASLPATTAFEHQRELLKQWKESLPE